jgi:hypothetical protein
MVALLELCMADMMVAAKVTVKVVYKAAKLVIMRVG